MINHMPVLLVVIPLLLAPICFIVSSRTAAWSIALLASISVWCISAGLLAQVLSGEALSYALGGWAAPWGIEYRIDTVNGIVIFAVTSVNLACIFFSRVASAQTIADNQLSQFYSAWILCVTGLLGICATNDIFNIFVFLEISSLSTYTLISFGTDRRALTASFRYLILGTVGATFFLIGVGFLYMLTGTLNITDMAERLALVDNRLAMVLAFGFLTIGLGVKMAMFPLHSWMPDAYTFAPNAVSALLAGTATKVGVYVFIRVFFDVFGPTLAIDQLHVDLFLVPLALFGIVFGSAIACWQLDVKRLLAWSSVAQLSYMILGVALATATGLTAALIHIFAHALMKAALFIAVGCLVFRTGTTMLNEWAGLGRRMPWTFSGLVIAGLSLLGIPLTMGFVSKWMLVTASFEQGWWWAVIAIVVSSLLAVVYMWRIVDMLWLRERPDSISGNGETDTIKEAPASLLIPLWALALANIYFGVDTRLTLGLAENAAQLLLGVTP